MPTLIDKAQPSPQQHEHPSTQHSPLYTHSLFSPAAAPARTALLPSLVLPVLYTALLLAACLALFLGSLTRATDISQLSVVAVNLDSGAFGAGVVAGIRSSLGGPGAGLRWEFVDVDVVGEVGGDAWARRMVLEEEAWAVLLVAANVSEKLGVALEEGDAAYETQTAATVYFASARNQAVARGLVVPAVLGVVDGIVGKIAGNVTGAYLASKADVNVGCVTCLVRPFVVREVDLVPFDEAVAMGPLGTGLIFLLTFTFQIFTILRAGASKYGHLFTLPSTLALRTILSLATYLFLSLTYTLILLAFQLPLTGHFPDNPALGFTTLWALDFLTMTACGFVLEAAATLSGMQFAPFFLNIWLIANAAPGFGAFETMPGVYRYGYAMPFWHAGQATRTIVFGTKSHLGLNFGVLVGWCVVGWVGIVGATAWRMERGKRAGRHYVP